MILLRLLSSSEYGERCGPLFWSRHYARPPLRRWSNDSGGPVSDQTRLQRARPALFAGHFSVVGCFMNAQRAPSASSTRHVAAQPAWLTSVASAAAAAAAVLAASRPRSVYTVAT